MRIEPHVSSGNAGARELEPDTGGISRPCYPAPPPRRNPTAAGSASAASPLALARRPFMRRSERAAESPTAIRGVSSPPSTCPPSPRPPLLGSARAPRSPATARDTESPLGAKHAIVASRRLGRRRYSRRLLCRRLRAAPPHAHELEERRFNSSMLLRRSPRHAHNLTMRSSPRRRRPDDRGLQVVLFTRPPSDARRPRPVRASSASIRLPPLVGVALRPSDHLQRSSRASRLREELVAEPDAFARSFLFTCHVGDRGCAPSGPSTVP